MRLRLFLAFTLVVAIAIFSVLVLTWQGTESEVRYFVSRGGMMGVDSLVEDLERFYQRNGSWQGAEALLQDWRVGRGMGGMMGGSFWLRVADPQGRYLADNRGAASGRWSSAERSGAVALHDARGQAVGYLVATGGTSAASERLLIQRLLRAGWLAASISGVLALLLALLFSYQLNRPVQALTEAAARLAGGDLSQRVPERGSGELRVLGTAFNHMAESLQRAEQNRTAMTADIAHELRTPIAIQRAHLEALQDGLYPLNGENLQPVLDQTELLTRLVEDLRTLALADAGELSLNVAPVSLPDLARRVLERFRPQAESSGIQLLLERGEDFPALDVLADPARIEQILNNLLSNALRHTPAAGEVRLTVAQEDGWAVVRVADTGSGISAEDLPRLFERFYRTDRSRSREAGGTGLGLAIARQLASAHGGELTASNQPLGGACFSLRLPVAR